MADVIKWGITCRSLEEAVGLLEQHQAQSVTINQPVYEWGVLRGYVPTQVMVVSRDAARHRVVAKRWLRSNGYDALATLVTLA